MVKLYLGYLTFNITFAIKNDSSPKGWYIMRRSYSMNKLYIAYNAYIVYLWFCCYSLQFIGILRCTYSYHCNTHLALAQPQYYPLRHSKDYHDGNEVIGDGMVNTLRPRQHGRHLADDTFKCISSNENVIISIKISLKFVPKGPMNNIRALVQIMAWRRPVDKPLSETMIS